MSELTVDLESITSRVSKTETTIATVDGKFANYSTTTQMNTAINQSASNIKLEASKTYATKNELTGKVDTDKVVSAINVSPESIKISANKITLEGVITANNYFKINTDGSMEARAGKIANWIINDYAIYSAFVETYIDAADCGMSRGCNDNLSYDKNGLVFWAGASWVSDLNRARPSNAKFRVYRDGTLYASNANITGTITGATIIGSTITSGTTINVTTDLSVGNNIYINQNVNSIKYIKFNENNYIMNMYTNSINYLRIVSNLRVSMVFEKTGSTSAFVNASSDGAYLSCGGNQIIASSGGNKINGETDFDNNVFLVNAKYIYGKNTNGDNYPIAGLGSNNVFYLCHNTYKTALRGSEVYLGNGGGTVTSDRTRKHNIVNVDSRYEQLFKELNTVSYIYNSDEKNRTRIGFIAQEVETAMLNCGLSKSDFGALDVVDDNLVDENIAKYNLNYNDFIALNTHMIQKTILRVDHHDDEIRQLKNENAQLKQELKNTQDKLNAFIQGNFEIREVVN